MKILAALTVSLLALTAACATPARETSTADRPHCPPSLLAETRAQPLLPDGATIPRPATAEDADGLDLTLEHMATLAGWGRAGWARAEEARRWCLETSTAAANRLR